MARRRNHPELSFATREKVVRACELRRALTPAEQRLWSALRRKALGSRARVQHVIRGWLVDFYIPAARLVIEVDGDIHDLRVDEDALRTEALECEGLTVIRFRNEQVLGDVESVLARIATHTMSATQTVLPQP